MTSMRVADYLISQLPRLGVDRVFAITGGGAMYLNDALRSCPDVDVLFNQHEQACALAVEGYARAKGTLGVAVVTSGPGGTNCVTGVLGMWHDSIPGLFISGQVRFDTTVASTGLPLRQLGDQEGDIVRLVAPITKYAAMVRDPSLARYYFEKAVYLARAGRPGPVWLDVPLNVQSALIDPIELPGFNPEELRGMPDQLIEPIRGRSVTAVRGATAAGEALPASDLWLPPSAPPQDRGALTGWFDHAKATDQARLVLEKLREAERPVILAGSAVRGAGALPDFETLISRLNAPVATAWNALDAMCQDHPLFVGRPGTIGDRAGNFAIQNADLIIVLGCRLNIRQIGYEFNSFARAAELIVVDIDGAELAKPTINPALAIQADVRWFIRRLLELANREPISDPWAVWRSWCLALARKYPVVLSDYRQRETPINPYVFVDELSDHLASDEILVLANGSACVTALQALRLKKGQQVIVNSGTAGMGYDLPVSIGVACARLTGDRTNHRVVCLAGDGSIQMNIQELETLVYYDLPIKVFVFNNDGYVSMRLTQDNLFAGARFGESAATGLGLPDMVAIANAYGIPASRVSTHAALGEAIERTFASSGPALLDVVMDPEQAFLPKVIAERQPDGRLVSKPLEDMFPWLDRTEFLENMLVDVYESEPRVQK